MFPSPPPTEDAVRALSADELAALPVFPLPRVVFFPGTSLPLHLFEPRYRRMVEDCIEQGPRVMAVVLLKEGWESQYEGQPPIHTVSGVGRIVSHERLSDGRHNVVVQGLARAELQELPFGDHPYRRAEAKLLKERGQVCTQDVSALVSCASSVVAHVRREHPEFALDVSPSAPPSTIADIVADRLVADVALRQQMLEELDVEKRMRLVTDAVVELLAMLTGRSRPPRGQLH